MLFDPLEEQFDLPTAAIKLGNSACWEIGVVRQEDQRLALGILDTYTSQRRWITLHRVEARQRPDLVADNAIGSIRLPGVAALEAQIRFSTNDKETAGLMQPVQLREVDIAAVHDVEGTGFWHQHVEDIDFVPLAIADVDGTRDIAAKVEQRVHLYCGFGAAKRRPRKHRQTQVDGRCVQGVDCIVQIDTERLVDIQPSRNADQVLGEVGVDAPISDRIGIGQGIPRHRTAKSHVVELCCLAAQTGFDVAQAFSVGQLREGHTQILIQTGEVLDLVLASVPGHATTESSQRQMCYHLRKNEFARVHEYRLHPGWKNRECYGRLSNRDQLQTRNNSFSSTRYETSV